jgi:hypothetical protein
MNDYAVDGQTIGPQLVSFRHRADLYLVIRLFTSTVLGGLMRPSYYR